MRATLRTPVRLARRGLERALVERRYELTGLPAAASPGTMQGERKAYAPTPWRLLRHILPPAEVHEGDVFADFGCGPGRVLLEAAESYPLRRVIGVEIEPELAEAARTLLRQNERH